VYVAIAYCVYNNKHLQLMITIVRDERVRTSGCHLYSTSDILLSDEKKTYTETSMTTVVKKRHMFVCLLFILYAHNIITIIILT